VIRAIAFLAIFSLAMVAAMVRFMTTFLSDDLSTQENRTLWGAMEVSEAARQQRPPSERSLTLQRTGSRIATLPLK
jgi:hypothetical protein